MLCLIKKICFYLLKLLPVVFVLIISTNLFAVGKPVNILSWWGYLDDPQIAKIVDDKCKVSMSHDIYYTNNEFLRRVSTNKNRYDLIIFSQAMYEQIKNQLPNSKINLSIFAKSFNPIIEKEYNSQNFPKNVIFFMHSLSGFLWNPAVIHLSSKDDINQIFKKANNNIIVMIDDPAEVWNLIDKAYYNNQNRPQEKSDELTLTNFKKLTQHTKVYVSNNFNQVYDQANFAFAFGWSGDAIVYMKQANKNFKFLIHPKLSYISSDLLAAINNKHQTQCVARVLMSKPVLDIVQKNTYYFSPYGDYNQLKLPIYRKVYKEVFAKLKYIPWLEGPLTSNEFQGMVNAWSDIQLNIHNS